MTKSEKEQFELLKRQNEYLEGNNKHVQGMLTEKNKIITELQLEKSVMNNKLCEKQRGDRLLDEKATLMDVIFGLINPDTLKNKKNCPYCGYNFVD